MKKLIALLAVCGFAFAFAACGKKTEPAAEVVDSAAVETPAPAVVDSAAAPAADSVKADSTAH